MIDAVRFGHKLRNARIRAGMKQEALQQDSGVSAGTIRRIEKGRSMGDISSVVGIADALHLSLDEALERSDYQEMLKLDMDLGEKIVMRREQLGLRQADLVQDTHLNRSCVLRMERGIGGSFRNLIKVADQLDVGVDWLLGRCGK